jgi:leucyl aminopeptidase
MSREAVNVRVVRGVPRDVGAIGVPVATEGPVPRPVGLSRAALAAAGFEGKAGQTLVVPRAGAPTIVAVGVGAPGSLDASGLRHAAAALARAASPYPRLATTLTDLEGVDARTAGQVVTEGVLLAGYQYAGFRSTAAGNGSKLVELSLVAGERRSSRVTQGAGRGQVLAAAVAMARDLANTPPAYLTARMMAEKAIEVAHETGLGVEVYDEHQLAEMGCGGIVGVNKASAEPPRMVKLTYTPRRAPTGHVALVGKGVMYDSGGISLKSTDAFHAAMKMDMSGAASVLAAMSTLRALRCPTTVTGYLMCTDNMPSGSALKLGDVLTIRNGKTIEIHNTDAEGRLILADGLSLAAELAPDAIIDIATLTGACLTALGTDIAGLLGNDESLVERVKAASAATDEPVWQLPLETSRYRKLLDSNVADMKNVGGPYGGTITAAIVLSEFVGEIPWAHLDIAGPMKVDADSGWLVKGATGFGTRLLVELVTSFSAG